MSVMGDYDAAFLEVDHRFHVGYLTDDRADLEATEVLGLLDLPRTSRIIDAGCGDGRLAVRLASLGHTVVAIDRDPAQIERTQVAASRRGVALEVHQADLCTFVAQPAADAAVLWFTTFGFLADEDNAAVLRNLRAGLSVRAPLVIDTLDPERVREDLASDPNPVVITVGEWVQQDVRSFDQGVQRLIVDRTVQGPAVESRRQLRLWLPARDQWSSVLGAAGFILEDVIEPEDDVWSMRVVARAR